MESFGLLTGWYPKQQDQPTIALIKNLLTNQRPAVMHELHSLSRSGRRGRQGVVSTSGGGNKN